MIRELSDSSKYSNVMLVLSLLTIVFGLAYVFLGILFLPFAIAFCAALFVFENPQKRILSFAIPLAVVAISILISGWYGISSATFALASVLLATSYVFGQTKAETVSYMSVLVFAALAVSLYLSGARECGSFSPSAVALFYSELLETVKKQLIESLMSANKAATDAQLKLTPEIIGEYFNGLTNLIVAIVGILSFAISGISIKVFSALSLHYCKNGILKTFAHFIPSKLLAYIYIIVSILSSFMKPDSVFSIAVINTSEILMFVFFYVGLRYAFALGDLFQKRSTIWLILAVAFLMFPGAFFKILSYLGAWFAITLQRQEIK